MKVSSIKFAQIDNRIIGRLLNLHGDVLVEYGVLWTGGKINYGVRNFTGRAVDVVWSQTPFDGTRVKANTLTTRTVENVNAVTPVLGKVTLSRPGTDANAVVSNVVTFTRSSSQVTTDVSGADRKDDFVLGQNAPNPFFSSTAFDYTLPVGAEVELAVYNSLGAKVCILESGLKAAGTHRVNWDGRDNAGVRLKSGIYFYRLHIRSGMTESVVLNREMILLR